MLLMFALETAVNSCPRRVISGLGRIRPRTRLGHFPHIQIAQMKESTLKRRLHAFHVSGEFLMLQQRSLLQPSSVLPSPCLTAICVHAASFTLS